VLTDFADFHFPEKKIVVVMDHLNTHKLSTLYNAFKPAEARRLVNRFEVHYTPKQGSWINMAEIEINVMSRQCLARRIPDRATMERKTKVWVDYRYETAKPIDWQFKTEDARIKQKIIS